MRGGWVDAGVRCFCGKQKKLEMEKQQQGGGGQYPPEGICMYVAAWRLSKDNGDTYRFYTHTSAVMHVWLDSELLFSTSSNILRFSG